MGLQYALILTIRDIDLQKLKVEIGENDKEHVACGRQEGRLSGC